MTSPELNFGLLLFPSFQWLDAAGPVDYINTHSHQYLSAFAAISGPGGPPKEVFDKAYPMKWHYISTDLNSVRATSGPALLPTTTYADCPPLNYLLVPGPDPGAPLPEGCAAFLQKLVVQPDFKALLMVCTGSIAVAQSGILDGFSACSNKVSLKLLAQAGVLNKKVKWVGNRRWIVDGKMWSAAGVTAGIDLAVEFAKIHFDPTLVDMVKDLTEYEGNPDQPDTFARILDGVDLA